MMPSWIQWVEVGLLARSPRPGFMPGAEHAVPRESVEAWVDDARALGVASIICLLSGDQLPLYERALPDGLLAHYRTSGFTVAQIASADGQANPYTPGQLDDAWSAFQDLPKPVLVHCSAGMDRTGRIVAHILRRLAESGDAS